MAPQLINEPPPRRSISLQQAMKLQNEDRAFETAKKCLRALSKKFLDVHVPYTQQDPERWDIFVQKAINRYPLFKKYKDAWPIKWYMIKHLGHTAYVSRQQTKFGQGGRGQVANNPESDNPDATMGESDLKGSTVLPLGDQVDPVSATSGLAATDPRVEGLTGQTSTGGNGDVQTSNIDIVSLNDILYHMNISGLGLDDAVDS
ncbi:uncharacterized protein FIBRA_07893 [Fibroporia radiculosa]|uniref:Uncharacterized protein n=1 Tax=Fibroporia radiculosa TaxID=599839 RepID=J4GFU8_9APHY|nr:uncharacterized protein FIBRA_07893 [Fibroporia radiculosa]CCM05663.1 predicted protein [Fibroporia radiculosa]